MYIEPPVEQDTQVDLETVDQSDSSSDEDQSLHGSDKTVSEIQPDSEDNDHPESTEPEPCQRSRRADGERNNHLTMV